MQKHIICSNGGQLELKGLTNIRARSPWSNEYDPPLEDGTIPTPKLRKLEITANEAFDTYREMYVQKLLTSQLHLIPGDDRYFEGGVSSVYLWDLDDGGFAGVVLLKKGTSHTITYFSA